MSKKSRGGHVYRCAKTGWFVTAGQAKRSPNTTVREKRPEVLTGLNRRVIGKYVRIDSEAHPTG